MDEGEIRRRLGRNALSLLIGKHELGQLMTAEVSWQRPGKLSRARRLQVFVDEAEAELQSQSDLRL
jgi:hypothetical protein